MLGGRARPGGLRCYGLCEAGAAEGRAQWACLSPWWRISREDLGGGLPELRRSCPEGATDPPVVTM